jgi:hypothetical protein
MEEYMNPSVGTFSILVAALFFIFISKKDRIEKPWTFWFAVLIFAILGGVLAARFKQPTVLGLLLVGAAIGPHALGFVTDPKITNIAIDVGAILLLFTVGVEFNLKKLIGLGTKPIIISIIKLGLVFFAGYHAALLLGFDNLPALYIGVILCITSTVIFIKVIVQKAQLPFAFHEIMFLFIDKNACNHISHIIDAVIFERVRQKIIHLNHSAIRPQVVFLHIRQFVDVMFAVKIKNIGVHGEDQHIT